MARRHIDGGDLMKDFFKAVGFLISLILIVVISLAIGLVIAYVLAVHLKFLLWIACSFSVFIAAAAIISRDKNPKI